MQSTLTQFPAINSLLGKIGVRKRRDALILGAVIGTCIVLLMLFRQGL